MGSDEAYPRGHRLGPYELLEVIGQGGFGRVYRAADTRLGRDVAVKTAADSLSREDCRRLEAEARATAALNHPHIIAIHDVGVVEDVPYIVTELLEGETLRSVLQRGPLPVRVAVAYGTQIADALTAAHAKGIVHRDLKPSNVFVSRRGGVKVLDFGIAKRAHAPPAMGTAETVTALTEPGRVPGTPSYLSPEQARGEPVDHRSDVFSFGIVLYEMLAGVTPFRAANRVELITAMLRDPAPPLPRPSGNAALEAILWRCLEKDPADRFQSMADLLFALRSVSSARPPHYSWAIAAAVVLAIVVVTLGWNARRFFDGSAAGTPVDRDPSVRRSIPIARPVAAQLVSGVFAGRVSVAAVGESRLEVQAPERLAPAVESVVRMAETLASHRFADEPGLRGDDRAPLFNRMSESPARVTLNVADVSAKGLLHLIAKSIGWPVVFDHSVQGTVTMDVADVPWDLVVRSAMEFQGNNLSASRFGDVWLISSSARAAELINSRLSQWVVGSSRAGAQQLARAFEPVRSPEGMILINRRLNKLVIIDRWETFANYARVLATVDDIDPRTITLPHLGSRYAGVAVDFDFNDEPPASVMRRLGQRLGINLAIETADPATNPQQVSRPLTGTITQARWDNVIDVIMLAASWQYESGNKVVHVRPVGREMSEIGVETVRLVRETPQFFEPYQRYLTPQGALTIEPSTRTVVIRDVRHRAQLLRQLIRLVDAHEP